MMRNDRSILRNRRIRAPCALPAQAERSFHPSGQWKVLTWPAHRNSRALQVSLEIANTVQAKVKDGGSERCVCFAALKDVNKALRVPTTSRGDHGNMQRFGTREGQVAIEACARAIAIHGSEEDFARAPLFRLPCPSYGVTPSGIPAPTDVGLESRFSINTLGVNGDDHGLRTIALGNACDQRWIGTRRGIDADLVGARFEDGDCVVQ